MKKTILVLLLAGSMQVNAQDESQWKFGPRLGVNFSNITEVDDAKSKTGLVAGAFLVYSFQEHFGVSADLLYSMEGAKYKHTETTTPGTTTTYDSKLTLSYLRVPLLFNYFAGQLGSAVRPKFFLGPDLGFLLAAKSESDVRVETNGSVTNSSTSESDKDGYNGMDLGAVVGAGVNFRLAESLWLDTDLRYYMGASELFENYPGDNQPKNNHLQVSLGLGIGLNR